MSRNKIPLLSKEEVELRHGGISKKALEEASKIFERSDQRKEEFCRKLEKTVPKLKKEIGEKGEISVPFEDLDKKLNIRPIITRKHINPISIYWSSKYCLWKNGINVTISRKDGEETAIIKASKPEDVGIVQLDTREDAIRRLAIELQNNTE
jgi:hypothetical protein